MPHDPQSPRRSRAYRERVGVDEIARAFKLGVEFFHATASVTPPSPAEELDPAAARYSGYPREAV